MERISTGVAELDKMIEGGLVKNSTVMIAGGAGSGKSTLGLQYLVAGAAAGESGVYITFEEHPANIRENMERHGWDLRKLEDDGMVKIVRVSPQDAMRVIEENYGPIVDVIKAQGASRVVLDSISTIEIMIEDHFKRRKSTLDLVDWLRENGVTTVMITESEQDPNSYSRHGLIEFVVDGVIVLYNVRKGSLRRRALEVLKLRGTKHSNKIVSFTIDKGIKLLPREEALS